MRILMLAISVAVLCPLGSRAQSAGRHELPPDQLKWSSTLAPGRSVQVKGGLGDITIVKSENDEFVVEVKRGTEGKTMPRVVIVETAKGAAVCADWTTAAAVPSPCATTKRMLASNSLKDYASVDLRISVPDGTDVDVRASEGDIVVGPLNASVAAETYTGDVRVIANGAKIKAENHRGTVEVQMSPEPLRQKIHASSIQGNVRVVVPPARTVHYELYTRGGRVRSVYPLRGETARRGPFYEYNQTDDFIGNFGPRKEKILSRLEVFTTADVAQIEIAQEP